jgi:hypothetical protein
LAPGKQQEFVVEVNGGDVSKVIMSVNEVTGNEQFGTVKEKGSGVWTYSAPPKEQTVTIRATSQEDTTKFATAQVTIGSFNPRLGPAGSKNPATGENEPGSGIGEASAPDHEPGSSPRRRPRRPRT